MTTKKAYVLALVIQVILAATTILSKVAFNRELSTFVFVFYRLAAGSIFLLPPAAIIVARRSAPPLSLRLLAKMFLYALAGYTVSLNLSNVSLKYTSTTVASAMCSAIPVITFFLALLMRMEVIDLKRPSGKGKAAGITFCLAGVLVIALYAGSSLSPLNHSHHGVVLAAHHHHAGHVSEGMWIMGTFLMLLACVTWSLWIVFQGLLLKEYPNKLLATLIQYPNKLLSRLWWQWPSRGIPPDGSLGSTSLCLQSHFLALWGQASASTYRHGAERPRLPRHVVPHGLAAHCPVFLAPRRHHSHSPPANHFTSNCMLGFCFI